MDLWGLLEDKSQEPRHIPVPLEPNSVNLPRWGSEKADIF